MNLKEANVNVELMFDNNYNAQLKSKIAISSSQKYFSKNNLKKYIKEIKVIFVQKVSLN